MADEKRGSSIKKGAASAKEKYLSFEINTEMYAVEILDVKEIIAMMKFTSVPKMPNFVKGVINLRGQVIPIVDMRLKFDLPETDYTERTTIIIGIIADSLIGFIVDRTADVLNISSAEMSAPPKFGTDIDTEFLKSMAKTDNGVVMVIDLIKIFTQNEFESVKSLENNSEI